MMRFVFVTGAAALMLAGPISLARAQTSTDWARCRAVADSLQRLSCYDSMAPQPAAATSGGAYQTMSLVDWKLDKRQLGQTKVEVEGTIMPFAENALLSVKLGDSSPVWVDVSAIPRDQRRRFLSCTGMCPAVVRGRGGSVMGQDGLIADSVTIR